MKVLNLILFISPSNLSIPLRYPAFRGLKLGGWQKVNCTVIKSGESRLEGFALTLYADLVSWALVVSQLYDFFPPPPLRH